MREEIAMLRQKAKPVMDAYIARGVEARSLPHPFWGALLGRPTPRSLAEQRLRESYNAEPEIVALRAAEDACAHAWTPWGEGERAGELPHDARICLSCGKRQTRTPYFGP